MPGVRASRGTLRLLLALGLAACSNSPGDVTTGPDTTSGPPPAPTYDIRTLASGIPFIPPSYTTGQPFRAHLVSDGARLYWTDGTVTPVRSIPVGGGPVTALAARVGIPLGATVYGPNVYWVDARRGIGASGCTGADVEGALWRTALDGTSAAVLALGDRCAGGASEVVVDASAAYWVTSTGSPNLFTIQRVPLDGTAPVPIYTGSAFGEIVALAADSDHVYLAQSEVTTGIILRVPKGGGPADTIVTGARGFRGGLVVRDSALYFGDSNFFDEHRIMTVPLSGGPVRVLADITGIDQSGVRAPRRIAVEPPEVYWIDAEAVHAVPLDSGATRTVVTGLTSGIDLAVAPPDAFWIESVCCAHGQTGTIRRAPLAGGPPAIVFDSLQAPTSLTISGPTLYWTEGGPIGSTEGFGRVAAAPAAGGPATTLAAGISGYFTPIATDGANVYIGDRFTVKRVPAAGGTVEELATGDFLIAWIDTDGRYVYWVEDGLATVRRVPVGGGAVQTLARVANGPAGRLSLRNAYVYWMDGDDAIRRLPADSGPIQILGDQLPALSDFAVDGVNLFYVEWDNHRLRRLPAAGGSPVTLSNAVGGKVSLALDDHNVYWIGQDRLTAIAQTGGGLWEIVRLQNPDPYFLNDVLASGDTVWWTEVGTGTIRRATPQ